MSCSRRTQTSPGTTPMMPPSIMSRMLSSVTPPSSNFDPLLPVTIHIDASQVGLGAALLQNNKPSCLHQQGPHWILNMPLCQHQKERCLLSSLEWRDSELTSTVDPLPSNQTTSPWIPSPRRNWQTCQPSCNAYYCTLQGYDYIICYHPSKEMALPDTLLSLQSTSWCWHSTGHCHLPCLPVSKSGRNHFNKPSWVILRCMHSCQHHHHWLDRGHKGSSFPLTSVLATPWDPHCWRLPCTLWRSPHYSSFGKGESTVTTAPVPSGNHQSPVPHLHGCIFWPGINKAIEEVVCQCETCTWFQAQNVAVPLMHWHQLHACSWQMCATDIFTLEGVDYLICGDFYSKLILVHMSSIWPEQHHQSHLTAQGNVLRAWNPRSPLLLTMVFNMQVPRSLISAPPRGITHETLKHSLSAIKWICRGMCKIGEACTPTC